MATNTMQLKKINVEIIKTVLKNIKSGTKNTIAAKTGLSIATCRNVLDELLKTGEVIEISKGPSTGGRPSRQFTYNENFAYVCGLYLRIEGKEKTLFSAVANMSGTIVEEMHLHPESISADTFSSIIAENIELFPEIKTICIGIPGVVNGETIDICDSPELIGIKLRKILTDRFGVSVIIENDVNSTAAGFIRRSLQTEPENLAYIYYPENGGPGCAIVLNGRIINGFSNFAGEVSYLPLGTPSEELGSLQNDKKRFPRLIAETLASLICIINPEKIIIAGKMFDKSLNDSISMKLGQLIPEKHIPELLFIEDIHENFIQGLIFLALEDLSCGLEVVETSIRGTK